jgi:hypothetical protein
LKVNSVFNGQGLSDKMVGQIFFSGSASETQRRSATRHQIIDQLTFDPNFGMMGSLPADVPVVLAWGRTSVIDVEVAGQRPSNSATVLFYIPVSMSIRGATVFQSDLMRSTVLDSDAMFFSKDPSSINFGQGSVTMAYRPISFDGTFTATKVHLAVGFGGDMIGGAAGKPVAPLPPECAAPATGASPSPAESPAVTPTPQPAGGTDTPTTPVPSGTEAPAKPDACPAPLLPDQFDGIPEVEVFDRTGAGTWRRLPHFQPGSTYDLDKPENYVDPSNGTILIRFVNDRQDGIGFAFLVSLEGTVR